MSALQSVRGALDAPGLFTLGLLCLGVGYPLGLLAVGAVPAFATLRPYLLAGLLVAVALELAFADALDDAFVRGETGRLLPDHRWFDRSSDDGDDDRDWSAAATLLTTLVTAGFQDVVPLSAPWLVGGVLGVVWTLAGFRVGRALSPVSEGARPPPRGVAPSDND